MTLRSATPQDVPAVLAMMARQAQLHESLDAAKYGYRADAMAMYGKWLPSRADDPRSVFLVAEREGRVIAFLIATVEQELPIYRLKEFGFIHDVWVEEEYRHEGVARQMTMLAIERFAKLGVKQIRLDTVVSNAAAQGLFRSCGFRPSVMEMLLELK